MTNPETNDRAAQTDATSIGPLEPMLLLASDTLPKERSGAKR
jgi:hypothetical protein